MYFKVLVPEEKQQEFFLALMLIGLKAESLEQEVTVRVSSGKKRETPKWVDAEPISEADVKGWARDHGVQLKTVKRLLSGGVNPDHISEVLEVRMSMTQFDGNQRIIASPTVEAIINVYTQCDCDADALEFVAEGALGIIGEMTSRVSSPINVGHLNFALYESFRQLNDNDAFPSEDHSEESFPDPVPPWQLDEYIGSLLEE